MKTTFIVVTYRSAAVLPECLLALRGLPDSSALVVDNGSDDDTVAVARSLGAEVLALDGNRGFAAAANAGAARAPGHLACFLNPDCHMEQDTLDAARRALGANPGSCAVPDFFQHGERLEGRQPGYTRRKLLADILETNGRAGSLRRHLRRHPRHHDHRWHWPLGTCLFVPVRFFRSVGGFDERYFLYMEDVEFGLAVSRRGGEVIPLGTTVTHLGCRGSAVNGEARLRLLNSGRLDYARRHFGRGFHLLLVLLSRRRLRRGAAA